MGNNSSSNCQSESQYQSLQRYDQQAASQASLHCQSDFTSVCDLVHHLKPGDIIQKKGNEFLQLFYCHFALFIGDGKIVHVVYENASGGKKGAIVKQEDMVSAFSSESVRKKTFGKRDF